MTLQNLFVSVVHKQWHLASCSTDQTGTGTRLKEERIEGEELYNCSMPVASFLGPTWDHGQGPQQGGHLLWSITVPPTAAETKLLVSHVFAPCLNPQLSLLFQ